MTRQPAAFFRAGFFGGLEKKKVEMRWCKVKLVSTKNLDAAWQRVKGKNAFELETKP